MVARCFHMQMQHRGVRRRSYILCAMCVCATAAFAAGAPDPSAPGAGSPAAATEAKHADHSKSTGVAPAKARGAKVAGTVTAAASRRGSALPQHPVGQLSRGGKADRPHSPPSAPARGRVAKASSPASPSGATIGNKAMAPLGARDPRGSSPSGRLAAPVSTIAPATSVKAVTGASRMSGPRLSIPAHLGGPAIGRTANGAIGGAQLHRKF